MPPLWFAGRWGCGGTGAASGVTGYCQRREELRQCDMRADGRIGSVIVPAAFVRGSPAISCSRPAATGRANRRVGRFEMSNQPNTAELKDPAVTRVKSGDTSGAAARDPASAEQTPRNRVKAAKAGKLRMPGPRSA